MSRTQVEIKVLAVKLKYKNHKISSKRTNKIFLENPRIIYRNIENWTIEVKRQLVKEVLEKFQKPLLEDQSQHQKSQWDNKNNR